MKIASKSADATGVVIRRISRREDVWGQVHLTEPKVSEVLLSEGYVEISELDEGPTAVVGSVDATSSDLGLSFIATRPLETGRVVAVPETVSNTFILYQVVGAVVEHTDVKGGAHRFIRAKAAQGP